MRPLTLTMEAFGSYAKEQTLDFNELGEHRLFLIHGPTGSGKTTVLDAICFALYGDTTGGERDAKGMRSDFAPPEANTRVSLDFALGERVYRVERTPEQMRPKLRGDGFTKQPTTATLWDRTDAAGEEEGRVLASKSGEVTKKVVELLGFRSDQFRQVIVLPQGRFRDLLLANSDDREKILQQLFDTTFYRSVQDELKRRAAGLRKAAETLQTRRTSLLEQAECETESDLAELIERLEKEQLEHEAQLEELNKQSRAAARALEQARNLEAQFAKADEAARKVKELEAEQATVEAKRACAAMAEKAAGLKDFAESIAGRRKAAEASAEALAGAKAKAEQAAETLAEATKRLEQAQAREPEREALGRRIADMERVRPLVDELAQAAAAATELKVQHEQAEAAATKAEARLTELTEELTTLRQQIEQAQEKKTDRRVLERAVQDAETALKEQAELTKLETAHAQAATADEQATAEETRAREHWQRAETELERLRGAWEQGSAARLAHELEPGAPCPVCGSTEHPAPATGAEEIPDDQAVAAARAAEQAARKALDEAAATARQAGQAREGTKAKLEAAAARRGKEAAAVETIEAKLDHARKALAAYDEEAAALAKRVERRAALDQETADAKTAAESSRKTADELARNHAAAAAKHAEKQGQVPEEWRDGAGLAAALESAQSRAASLKQELADAQSQEKEAVAAQRAAAKSLEDAAAREKQDAAEREQAEAQWRDRLKAAGFDDEHAYRNATLAGEELAALKQEIAQWDESLLGARTLAKDSAAAVAGKQRPDLHKLKEDALAAETAQQVKSDECGRNKERIETQQKRARDLAALAKEFEQAEHDYGILGRLAEAANGQNAARVSLQRFVLATRLDDVLIAATRRLESMSRGRYRLQRITSTEDRRSAAGLELEVEDAYTGKTRPVATLSGGESFQAALALALGLSETVQAYAGGIRLDTIFVDEGFGSLDPEALDLAVNTLIDLQQSGRMVGVISHVPELKERIDVRLEVRASESGSRAGFRLP